MRFLQSLKSLPKQPSSRIDNEGECSPVFTWNQVLSPHPSPASEDPPSTLFPSPPLGTQLSTMTEIWPEPPVRSPSERPKRPTSFFRTTSWRSERSERSIRSTSSRATSTSRDQDSYLGKSPERTPPNLSFQIPDPDSTIFATNSPYVEDSGDEGLAFEDFHNSALKVIVVGAGFAGLSTAIACARQGFAVTVVERSDGRVAAGDSILLGSNATRLFYKWGIGREMYQKSSRAKTWIFHDKAGTEVHREDLDELSRRYGAPICQGARTKFVGVLGTEARLLGVKIRYEAEVTGFSDSEHPAVILRGGEVIRGDVVVVCDGIRSVSRTLLASPEVPPIPRKSSGYSIYRAVIGVAAVRSCSLCKNLCDSNIHFWLGLDSHVEIWPMNDGKELAFTFTHPDVFGESSLGTGPNTAITTVLKEISDWDPALRACIGKFPKALNWTILEDSVGANWVSKGRRIVFAGDAVHPLSPASFQAGTQAVEDGATVALCLALAGVRSKSVPLALEVYEKLRKKRIDRAGKLGRKQQRILHTFVNRDHTAYQALDPALILSPLPSKADALRPLTFELFDFDAEQYVLDNFASLACAHDGELGRE